MVDLLFKLAIANYNKKHCPFDSYWNPCFFFSLYAGKSNVSLILLVLKHFSCFEPLVDIAVVSNIGRTDQK